MLEQLPRPLGRRAINKQSLALAKSKVSAKA